jgi:hypothetical protein
MDASKNTIREWKGKNWKVCDFSVFETIINTARNAFEVIKDEVQKREKRAGANHACNMQTFFDSEPLCEYLKDLKPFQKKHKHIKSLHEYLQTVSRPTQCKTDTCPQNE